MHTLFSILASLIVFTTMAAALPLFSWAAFSLGAFLWIAHELSGAATNAVLGGKNDSLPALLISLVSYGVALSATALYAPAAAGLAAIYGAFGLTTNLMGLFGISLGLSILDKGLYAPLRSMADKVTKAIPIAQ